MIDQNLIQNNIDHVAGSLQNLRPSSINGLYMIDNLFTQELIDKLLVYLESTQPRWKKLSGVNPNRYRQEINWDADTVVEEAHDIVSAQTEKINQIMPEQKLKFLGLNIWKDIPGYRIPLHTDNPVIIAALQVYLTEHPGTDLGTEFTNGSVTVNVPEKLNCGYLANNSNPILHKTTNTVPEGSVRYSLYAIWAQG